MHNYRFKCDWICKNYPYWHSIWNSIYSLTLKLHSSTVQCTSLGWPDSFRTGANRLEIISNKHLFEGNLATRDNQCTEHKDIDSQVCFHRWLLSNLLSNHEGALQGMWSHWMALIRMCVVPNCSQWMSRLCRGLRLFVSLAKHTVTLSVC